jgi:hypothetical protein
VAKPVKTELAPGNYGSGLAVRASGRDEFEAAIVCDNNMEDTRVPSRLLYLRGLRMPVK